MRINALTNFLQQFGKKILLNLELITEKNGRFFQISSALKPFVKKDFFYAGAYLGKVKKGKFFPSFNLIGMLDKQDVNTVVVGQKAAWLFICGRDILAKSIVRLNGSCMKGSNILVLNEFGECLGFGRIVEKLHVSEVSDAVAIRNVLDIGDFLRRER